MSDPYGKVKLTNKRKVVIMTNTNIQEILAKNILDRYTPFAFKCDCLGTHPECESAMQDTYAYAQMDTVRRIAEYIKNFDIEL
jgi:hypothetical protein